MTEVKNIAFLGIGLMGLPMAKNLIKAEYNLKVWNRSHEKTVVLTEDGAIAVRDLSSAVSGVDLIISMLADGEVVANIIQDAKLRASIQKGTIWVDMSSTKPAEAVSFSKSLEQIGVRFVDAPVSGGTKGAQQGTLAIMVGADEVEFNRVFSVLSCLGRAVHVGPVGTGQLSKLANQLIVGSTIGAVAEAILLLETGGANPDAVRDALRGGFADSAILQQHGKRMTSRDFTPGGLSSTQLKDLDNILAQARIHGLTLPIAQQIRDRFNRYVGELDGANKDHAGLFEELLNINEMTLTND